VVTALVLPGGTAGTIPNAGTTSSAPITKATLLAKLLAAFSATSNEIVYMHATYQTIGVAHTDPNPTIADDWYYPLIASYFTSKQWTARTTTLNGQAAIELTLKDRVLRGKSTVNSWIEYLWVDASTYLPLHDVTTFGPPGGTTDAVEDFQYLPATPANLAKLTPPIPAGFRQVTPPSPPKWAKPAGPLHSISPNQTPPSAVLAPSVSPAPR
jgi:hypothetical protein